MHTHHSVSHSVSGGVGFRKVILRLSGWVLMLRSRMMTAAKFLRGKIWLTGPTAQSTTNPPSQKANAIAVTTRPRLTRWRWLWSKSRSHWKPEPETRFTDKRGRPRRRSSGSISLGWCGDDVIVSLGHVRTAVDAPNRGAERIQIIRERYSRMESIGRHH